MFLDLEFTQDCVITAANNLIEVQNTRLDDKMRYRREVCLIGHLKAIRW